MCVCVGVPQRLVYLPIYLLVRIFRLLDRTTRRQLYAIRNKDVRAALKELATSVLLERLQPNEQLRTLPWHHYQELFRMTVPYRLFRNTSDVAQQQACRHFCELFASLDERIVEIYIDADPTVWGTLFKRTQQQLQHQQHNAVAALAASAGATLQHLHARDILMELPETNQLLQSLSTLQSLQLMCYSSAQHLCQLTPHIASAACLQELVLQGMPLFRPGGQNRVCVDLISLSDAAQLTSLTLYRVCPTHVSSISRLTRLQELTLDDVYTVADAAAEEHVALAVDLSPLSSLLQLTSLCLSYLDTLNLQAISSLKALQHLELQSVRDDDADLPLAALQQLTQLRTLRSQHIWLVAAAGWDALASLRQLMQLQLGEKDTIQQLGQQPLAATSLQMYCPDQASPLAPVAPALQELWLQPDGGPDSYPGLGVLLGGMQTVTRLVLGPGGYGAKPSASPEHMQVR